MSDVLYIGFDEGGPTCQVCGDYRADAKEVACVKCGTLHHEDCWQFVGRCTTFGCGSKLWGEPKVEEVMVLHVREDDPDPVIPGWKAPVPAVGARTPSSRHEYRDTRMVVKSKAVDLSAPNVRLDLTTPLEAGSGAMAFFGAILSATFFINSAVLLTATSVMMTLLATIFWSTTDCTYGVNNDDRTLDYRRQIFGNVDYYPVFHFDDVEVVTVKGTFHTSKNSRWWEYCTVAVLKNASVVEITDSTRNNHQIADSNAASFARHVGARYLAGRDEHLLEVTWAGDQLVVRHRLRGWFGGYAALE